MMFNCPLCHQDAEITIEKDGPIETAKCQCTKCKQILPEGSISIFMKQTLRSQKQYLTSTKSGFQIDCKKCGRPIEAILSKSGDKALCSICGETLVTTPFMLNALRSLGKREKV